MAMLLWGIPLCPTLPLSDFIQRFPHSTCSPSDSPQSIHYITVTEGRVRFLYIKALNMTHSNKYEYIALLFYASCCPFSLLFKPVFSILSSLYPLHSSFAVRETSVRRRALSKYGVHGFPMLFILISTMRVRYRGSPTLGSLISFLH